MGYSNGVTRGPITDVCPAGALLPAHRKSEVMRWCASVWNLLSRDFQLPPISYGPFLCTTVAIVWSHGIAFKTFCTARVYHRLQKE